MPESSKPQFALWGVSALGGAFGCCIWPLQGPGADDAHAYSLSSWLPQDLLYHCPTCYQGPSSEPAGSSERQKKRNRLLDPQGHVQKISREKKRQNLSRVRLPLATTHTPRTLEIFEKEEMESELSTAAFGLNTHTTHLAGEEKHH